VATNALPGVQRALLARVRAQVLGGRRGPRLAADAGSLAKRAVALLAAGLTDARKPPSPRAARPSTNGIPEGSDTRR
jgi:hypothetical protein